jgi:hypothetical protein
MDTGVLEMPVSLGDGAAYDIQPNYSADSQAQEEKVVFVRDVFSVAQINVAGDLLKTFS